MECKHVDIDEWDDEWTEEMLLYNIKQIFRSGDQDECSFKHILFGLAAIVLGGNVPAGKDGRGCVDYETPTGDGKPLSSENVERWAFIKGWIEFHGVDEFSEFLTYAPLPWIGVVGNIDYHLATTKSIWGID